MSSTTRDVLSIGVPAFNQGKWLKASLDSLIAQSTTAGEIVVSDNHSTDDTPMVLAEFAGKVKVIRPQKRLGMAAHWNFLASNLQGDWFSLLSSDDMAKPTFVSVMLRGMERSSAAILVRSGWETIDSHGRMLEKRYLLSVKRITAPPRTFYEQLLGPKLSFAAFALKKSAWKQAGGFPEDCAIYSDWAMWLKISPFGQFIYEPDIVSRYRVGYRPGLERERLLAELADDAKIYTTIIPGIALSIPNFDHKKVLEASRARFLKRLAYASHLLKVKERERAASTLQAWARIAGCEKQLAQFRAGRKFRYKKGPSALKRIARSLYQRLLHS